MFTTLKKNKKLCLNFEKKWFQLWKFFIDILSDFKNLMIDTSVIYFLFYCYQLESIIKYKVFVL